MSYIEEVKAASPQSQQLYWRHKHILDLDDFTSDEIELVLNTADIMKDILKREIKRVPTLRGKTMVTLFYEPSTRTRMSFELAAKALGADVLSMSTTTSSVVKGESLVDTVRTVQSLGADIVVMRHSAAGAPYLAATHLNVSVINGGDGCHAHPTQALLDLYTIKEKFGKIEGLKVVIVGDILHSRVARSNSWALTTAGAEVVLVAPPTLLPGSMYSANQAPLTANQFGLPQVKIDFNLDRAIEGASVIMALRLQKERQESGLLPSIREYINFYQLNSLRLRRAAPDAMVMHPGPMNEGVEISPEVAHSSQSAIETQVTNGVAIRMALLYLLLGGAGL